MGKSAIALIQIFSRDDRDSRARKRARARGPTSGLWWCRRAEEFAAALSHRGRGFRIAEGPSVQPSLGLTRRFFFRCLISGCGPSWA